MKMKYTKELYSYLFIFAVLISCQTNKDDSIYFNGEINLVEDITEAKKLTSTKIELDGPYCGFPAVYDSIVVFWNNKLPDTHFHVFNLKTGEEIGNFCSKGGGPEDAYSLPPTFQLYTENGELKTLLFAQNESKLMIWNISKSVEMRKTVLDTVFPFDWKKEHGIAPNRFIFRLDRDTILATVSPTLLTMKATEATLPCYEKRTLYSNRLVEKYGFYKKPLRNEKTKLFPGSFFNGMECMKPDGSKIVQGMVLLSQINILDINTGVTAGYRLKGTPDFSFLKTMMSKAKTYYTRMQCDDRFIYALYMGEIESQSDFTIEIEQRVIHVFDWNGNFIQKVILEHPAHEIWLDPTGNKLYTMDNTNDGFYSYNLNELKLKQ
jgi:hypothetical protein